MQILVSMKRRAEQEADRYHHDLENILNERVKEHEVRLAHGALMAFSNASVTTAPKGAVVSGGARPAGDAGGGREGEDGAGIFGASGAASAPPTRQRKPVFGVAASATGHAPLNRTGGLHASGEHRDKSGQLGESDGEEHHRDPTRKS